jgi:hypothetical protein
MSDLYADLLDAFEGEVQEAQETPTEIRLPNTYRIDLDAGTCILDEPDEETERLIAAAVADARTYGPAAARRRWLIRKPETYLLVFTPVPDDA